MDVTELKSAKIAAQSPDVLRACATDAGQRDAPDLYPGSPSPTPGEGDVIAAVYEREALHGAAHQREAEWRHTREANIKAVLEDPVALEKAPVPDDEPPARRSPWLFVLGVFVVAFAVADVLVLVDPAGILFDKKQGDWERFIPPAIGAAAALLFAHLAAESWVEVARTKGADARDRLRNRGLLWTVLVVVVGTTGTIIRVATSGQRNGAVLGRSAVLAFVLFQVIFAAGAIGVALAMHHLVAAAERARRTRWITRLQDELRSIGTERANSVTRFAQERDSIVRGAAAAITMYRNTLSRNAPAAARPAWVTRNAADLLGGALHHQLLPDHFPPSPELPPAPRRDGGDGGTGEGGGNGRAHVDDPAHPKSDDDPEPGSGSSDEDLITTVFHLPPT